MSRLNIPATLAALSTAAVLLLGTGSPPVHSQGLPELSDSAALVLSNDQAKIFGKQVMLNIRAQSKFSSDLLLQDYFVWLAGNLVRNTPRDFGQLIVSVAIDPAINAFAVPGGYITANTGLIQNTRTEGELASVLAHEIGHQSQRHISRQIERQKQLKLPAMAAMLGGLLLGGQAGTAAIVSTQAAVASDRLSYSRTFEREADATGMNILAATGYDPDAMPAFFSQLEAQSRLYGGLVLEFLSTHPVSSDRIADSKSRAGRINQLNSPPQAPADRLDFDHAKARTFALYDEPVEAVIKRFRHTLEQTDLAEKEAQVAAYGLVIALMRNDENAAAGKELNHLLEAAPGTPLYTLLQADLAIATHNAAEAIELFTALYQSDKTHPAYIEGYTRALVYQKEYASAIRILRKSIRHHPEYGWAYGMLGKAYAANGQTLNAIFVEAQQLKNAGLYTRALNLLYQQTREPHPDSSDYLSASIDSLIKQIEEEKRQIENFSL